MCILFIYNGSQIAQSDYSLILVTNRDENYDRASQIMGPWPDDPHIIGGRDLEIVDGGTWLALSPARKKLGVLLNLPGINKPNAKSRGKIVTDYVKSNKLIQDYVEDIRNYTKDYNEFIIVATEMSNWYPTGDDKKPAACRRRRLIMVGRREAGFESRTAPSIYSYSNVTDKLLLHNDTYLGFGNCLPDAPLKKVEAGKDALKHICEKYNKVDSEKDLVEKLLQLLKSDEEHLPDHQLETKRPNIFKELSSIYVSIPQRRYGTRTHTLVLLTKTGRLSVTELTLQPPIDPLNPNWNKSEFMFDL